MLRKQNQRSIPQRSFHQPREIPQRQFHQPREIPQRPNLSINDEILKRSINKFNNDKKIKDYRKYVSDLQKGCLIEKAKEIIINDIQSDKKTFYYSGNNLVNKEFPYTFSKDKIGIDDNKEKEFKEYVWNNFNEYFKWSLNKSIESNKRKNNDSYKNRIFDKEFETYEELEEYMKDNFEKIQDDTKNFLLDIFMNNVIKIKLKYIINNNFYEVLIKELKEARYNVTPELDRNDQYNIYRIKIEW